MKQSQKIKKTAFNSLQFIKRQNHYIISILLPLAIFFLIHTYIISMKKANHKNRLQLKINIIAENINDTINTTQQILDSAAKNKTINFFIKHKMPANHPLMLTTMDTIKNAAHASFAYILNSNGTTIYTSSKAHYLIGNNYQFRPYFKRAAHGVNTIYPALGVTTKKRGIYHSAPIYTKGRKNPIAIMVIKTGLKKIKKIFANITTEQPIALISPDGIIFASNRKNWLFHSIKKISKQQQQQLEQTKQYGGQIHKEVTKKITNKIATLSNKEYYITRRKIAIPGWSIISFNQLITTISLTTTQKNIVLAILGTMTTLSIIIGTLLFNIHKRKKSEKELAYHKANLEKIVEKKTARLIDEINEHKKTDAALEKSKNLYKTIFENTGTATVIVNADTTISLANNEFARLSGYSKEELENGASWTTVTSKKDTDKMLTYHWNRRHNLPAPNNYEFSLIDKNGTKKDAIAFAALIPNTDSSLISILDISERKETERQLIQSEKKLKDSNAAKDKFLSIIAHDLRNPLSAIMSFSSLLSMDIEKISKEKIAQLAKELTQIVNNTAELLENLLTWASVQAGTIKSSPQTLYLKPYVDNIINLLKNSAQKKAITITSKINKKLQFFADIDMAETILRNLLTNAIKFTYHGGNINISASKEKNSRTVTIAVKDSGIGIQSDKLDKIFRIDSKTNTKGTANERGTGLGLPLCKDFIKKCDGEIWVETEPDKGSTFYFTLPSA